MTSSSSPPSMPTALVAPPDFAPRPGTPPDTPHTPTATLAIYSLSLHGALRTFPPAMPADWVGAVSEPLVPPVPPKLNDELSMFKLALELAVMRPLLWMKSSSSPPSMPTALVAAPEL